jgi:hypothetical protein
MIRVISIVPKLTLWQSIFAADILFIAAASFAKASTLYLMMRLFNLNGPKSQNLGVRKVHWWLCIGLLGIVLVWGIGSIIGISVNCSTDNFIRASASAQCPGQVYGVQQDHTQRADIPRYCAGKSLLRLT